MKIKIHKGFRGLLSVLVAVMLLVGIMPTQVWQGIKADALQVYKPGDYIYFDTGNNNTINPRGQLYGWDTGHTTMYIGYKNSNNSWTWEWHQMEDITSTVPSKWTNGKVFRHQVLGVINDKNEYNNGIQFSPYANAGDNNAYDKTEVIVGNGTADNNLKKGMVYYANGNVNNSATNNIKVSYYPFYRPLTSSSTFSNSLTKDTNVIVDGSGTFKQKTNLSYVNATLFDYFSDYELVNGTTRVNINDGSSTVYDWFYGERRVPTLTFDKALSDYYGSSYAQPLYFSDIHHELQDNENQYDFRNFNDRGWGINTGTSYELLYHNNNSLRRSGLPDTTKKSSHSATLGLYKNELTGYTTKSANETLAQREVRMQNNAKRLQLSGGKDAKWFDSTWLSAGTGDTHNSTEHMIGASYAVDFPFWELKNLNRTITINGSEKNYTGDYYYINSEDQDKALRIHKDSQGTYYLAETNQEVKNFSHKDDDGNEIEVTNGFYPFNNRSDIYKNGSLISDNELRMDRLNNSFGVYMEIPFKLTSNKGTVNGTDNGTPITFTFSGDDDLLVYIDGKLVLDVGGDHGKVQGEINLQQKKSWVSSAKTSDGNGETTSVTWAYGTDNKTELQNITVPSSITNGNGVKDLSSLSVCEEGSHVMEIFYVERGLFDSNMEIMYNLPVIYNRTVEVEKQVESTLNPVMKSATNGSNIATNLNNLQFPIQMEISEGNTSSFTNPATPNTYTLNTTSNTSFISNNQMLLTDDDVGSYTKELYQTTYLKIQELGTENLRYNGSALSGKTVSSLFDTRWQYYNVSGGSVTAIENNSTGPAQDTENTGYFRWLGTTTSPSRVKFTNTLKTGTLKINKTINGTAPNENKTFVFTVTLNNVGGIGLEESTFTGADGTNGGDKIEFTVNVPISLGQTTNFLEIPGIPINTEYTVEETDTQGYTSSGIQTGTIETTGTNNAGITNTPPSSKFKIRVQSYFTQNNSAQEVGTPGSIKLKLQKSIDGGSNWSDEGSDITISTVQTDDTNGRKYFELLLNEDFEYNTNHKYRILEYDSSNQLIGSTGGYDASVFTAFSEQFTNNSDTKKANRAVSEVVSEDISGTQTSVLTLSVLNVGPIPIALKIQKVWGTTTVYPTSVKFTVERSTDGSTWEYVDNNFIGFDGTQLTADNHMITLTDTQSVTVTNGDISNVIWGAYLFNESDKDIDNNGNVYQYRITEYTSAGVKVNDGDIFYFDNNNDTVMFSAGYRPAAFAPGYLNSYSGQTEAAADYLATISDYESTYGDTIAHTMRVVPLSIINSPVPDPDAPATGGHGGYIPTAGGFIAILLAGAGYFIYKKRIFA